MSKHQRHKQKKIERARRVRMGGKPGTAIIAATAVAAGTTAYASPVRYDNPDHGETGHFHWAAPIGSDNNWLDFTQPASAQPGAGASSSSTLKHEFSASAGSVVDEGASPVSIQVNGYFLAGVTSGELIPASGFAWSNFAYNYYGGYESGLPADAMPFYLGVRFDLGNGDQYGWIGVVNDGPQMEAFAWGYETEPGVPIPAGAPEPGSLALLAFGAAGALTRRKRRKRAAE